MDGCPIDAVELVEVAQTETRADFLELMRRVRALDRRNIGLIPWKGLTQLKDVVGGLRGLMTELEPTLPPDKAIGDTVVELSPSNERSPWVAYAAAL